MTAKGSAPWSAAARAVWGKTEREGYRYLALVQHLEDSAEVAGALWDHWLPLSVRAHIAATCGGDNAQARSLVMWLAGIHDVGKASPGFAVKASYMPAHTHLVDGLAAQGLLCPPHVRGSSDKLPRHCRIGHLVVRQWLINGYAAEPNAADALASPVGAHHGVPPEGHDLRGLGGTRWTGLSDPAWSAVQAEILEGMASRTESADLISGWVAKPPSKSVQVLLTAIVVVADWLASDERRFPYAVRGRAIDRLSRAHLGQSLLGPWIPAGEVHDAVDLLMRRFPDVPRGSIRPTQSAVHDEAMRMSEPGLMVVEAPMGIGKTEAALLAAEVLAHRFGLGGVFIGLPTMATTDAMFGRVLAWTRNLECDDRPTVTLAHGKARLDDTYRGMIANAYAREVNAAEEDGESGIVTTWMLGRRKGILANMVVGTIDQALLGALKARHLALRHLGLAGKVVIIDEVHAADEHMRQYLVRALEWLAAYQTPVILLSATLPPAQLEQFTRAYASGRGVVVRDEARERSAYPQVTVQGSQRSQRAVAWSGAQVPVAVEASLCADATLARVVTSVESGACVVVVRNTVARAQQSFEELRQVLGGDRVRLLHSRFVASDRAYREAELLRLLGKPGPGVVRPRGMVVVGTQVLEQSLDIDADLMVSDHAPIDLLLQRVGRLHRHQRGDGQRDRPEMVVEPRLLIEHVPSTQGPAFFEPGAVHVYGRRELLRSASVLQPHLAGRAINLPRDIPTLVDRAYDDGLPAPLGWESDWAEAEEEAHDKTLRSRERAKWFRLGGPTGHNLVGWLQARAIESDDRAGARAQVRDSEDSLEVLLVWRDEIGAVRLLPGPGRHSGAFLGHVEIAVPEDDLALSVLGSSVRLPSFLTRGQRMDMVIRQLEREGSAFAGWQQSPWLAGQLMLCLDADLSARIAGFDVEYDSDLGLIVTKTEDGNG